VSGRVAVRDNGRRVGAHYAWLHTHTAPHTHPDYTADPPFSRSRVAFTLDELLDMEARKAGDPVTSGHAKKTKRRRSAEEAAKEPASSPAFPPVRSVWTLCVV
jgi:hypothetical protein